MQPLKLRPSHCAHCCCGVQLGVVGVGAALLVVVVLVVVVETRVEVARVVVGGTAVEELAGGSTTGAPMSGLVSDHP